MIADEVPQHCLGRAMSVFLVGSLLGAMLAFILGGALLGWTSRTWPEGAALPVIGHVFHWQIVFFALGIPGLLVAAVFFCTVAEPKRKNAADGGMRLSEVIDVMREYRRVYFAIIAGVALVNMGSASATAWYPALLERKYGLQPDAAGIYLAGALVLPGIISALLGGALADRLRQRGHDDAYLRVAFYACMVSFLPFGLAALMPSEQGLAAMAATGTLAGYMTQTLSATALQSISPGGMRATAAGFMTAVVLLVGYGLGPLIVAFLTDYVFRDEGALDYSLAIVVTVSFFVGGLFYFSGRQQLAAVLEQQGDTPA